METIINFFENYVAWLSFPRIQVTDIIEILMIAFAIYHVIVWVKQTRAWMLVKGLIVLLILWLIASILNLNVILWIFFKSINVGITAVIIVFQPEFRKALEQLGQNNLVMPLFNLNESKDKNERFSDQTVAGIVKATFDLAKTKTGALIVIEKEIPLNEFEKTGIAIDSLVSSQLLINIFEHNTPLHDGAVIIRNNRLAAATCYLPLTDNLHVSKDLGTRHRAGIGVSEASDCLTVIVSEETGKVSIAIGGTLIRNVDGDYLRNKLIAIQNKPVEGNNKKVKLWKGRTKITKKS
ncbi:membrane protein [Anaerocolumna cellulosilytica]|uniref:Diadenylate cyclase n=1 Tax=Anaerocolumna cellulosilytica TaxID=433286 RepID=A0A6S6RB69_9FIRM|nr:diadenylate cyclase CdaA [Anaerocolumna cellulosilytica]MBB5196256.1 diadenylate cyclase [Anaerocolumna cellulosilytica]BCJ96285.1 membrane protein [Anaerocolumna cellulosilytica]